MLLKDFIPAADLREFVQLYRIIHFRFEKGTELPFKAYPPRPEHCLAFYPHETEKIQYQRSGREVSDVPVVLYGQFSEVTNRFIGHDFLVFQIIFYPGALFRLTGIPATEFTNQYMHAEDVFGRQLNEVNEQLYTAPEYNAMLNIANRFVRELVRKHTRERLPIDNAFALLLQTNARYGVDQLALDSCMSIRTLERKFKERTGVNPKLYERIVRFDRAFRMKNAQPGYTWLRIAMECGYHDYQHLAKEYKDFTNLGPNAFHEIEDRAPERNFGLVEGYYES